MDEFEKLSVNTRKALCIQLGESAGEELAKVLDLLLRRMPTVAVQPSPGRFHHDERVAVEA